MAERSSTRTASRRTTPQAAPLAPEPGRVVVSQSPPKRTTRATRSRSHDISDSEDGRKGARARQGTKRTTPAGADNAARQSTTKSRSGRAADGSRALQDLPTVTEDPDVIYPDLAARGRDDEGQIGEQLPAGQPSKSPGGASAFSGTTARTSLSTRELSDMSSEEMLDALPDLADVSNKILAFLVPSPLSEASVMGVIAQLQTKDSRANKNLRRLGSTFQIQKDIYGGESYINPRGVLRELLGIKQISDLDAAQWRPDAVLQKANLAVLVSIILSHSVQEQDDQVVEELEQAFPISFLEGFVESEIPKIGSSALTFETLRLALEVRTQYAIHSLARHAGQRNFDFDDVLHQVFYKNGINLKGWTVLGLRAEDLTEKAQLDILERLKELRNAFAASSEDPIASIEELKKDYPWATFIQETMAWIGQRLNEIEMQIDLLGGIGDIHLNLSNEIQTRRLAASTINDDDDVSPQLILNYDPPSEASLTTSDQHGNERLRARTRKLKVDHFSLNSPKAVSSTKSLKAFMTGRKAVDLAQSGLAQPATSNIQVASTAGPSTVALPVRTQADEPEIPASAPAQVLEEQKQQHQQEDDWRPQVDDEDELLVDSEEDHYANAALALKRRNDAESNKENIAEAIEPQREAQPQRGQRRLIDPQANAVQISWDSQDSIADKQVEDVSEDEGFQEQILPRNAALRRITNPPMKRPATGPAKAPGRSPKKVRLQEPGDSRNQASANARNEEPPAPSRSQTVIQDDDDDRPAPTQMDEYKAANAAAKERKAFQLKPTQIRTPWTEEETERLIALIVKHGASWKSLKQEDKIWEGGALLEKRDQVALKDKARNIKMDYLKSTRWLPKNFYRIPISRIHIERLRSDNIIYDKETGQREDALDVEDD